MTRKIIHIDMDAFFASVEQRDHPELRGKPVAVGGAGRRGVVAAASYEARASGVRSAMPGSLAARLCPDLIFVKHRFDVYKDVSRQVMDIFHRFTDLVEPLSLDEAFLDVSDPKEGPASATLLAKIIRETILKETQLTASAGVSYCKFLAKIASGVKKPNGQYVILPHEALAFLEQLKVESFFGVGEKTAHKMHKVGIFNGKDLKERSRGEIERLFGKSGSFFYQVVRGVDERPVIPYRERKSVGVEHTYLNDIGQGPEMVHKIEELAEELMRRALGKERPGHTLTLKVKFSDFHTISRSRTLHKPFKDAPEALRVALDLLESAELGRRSVRLLGLQLSNLASNDVDAGNVPAGIQLKLPFNEFNS